MIKTNNRLVKSLFIVGPTASGKSSLALEIAKNFDCEIICADSQTLRRELNLGTAKPTRLDQKLVPHHMIDKIDPYQPYSVADFAFEARNILKQIESRDRTSVIVGGSGLYIDSLFYNFSFRPQLNQNKRHDLELMSIEKLQSIIAENDFPLPKNSKNRRHLIRTIESGGVSVIDSLPLEDSIIIGLDLDRKELEKNIANRIDYVLENGFMDEARDLIKKWGLPVNRVDAIAYQIVIQYLKDTNNEIDIRELKKLWLTAERQYSKRQRTWFKRNKHIIWFSSKDLALNYVNQNFLNV